MIPAELYGAAAALGAALASFENELDKYKAKALKDKNGGSE